MSHRTTSLLDLADQTYHGVVGGVASTGVWGALMPDKLRCNQPKFEMSLLGTLDEVKLVVSQFILGMSRRATESVFPHTEDTQLGGWLMTEAIMALMPPVVEHHSVKSLLDPLTEKMGEGCIAAPAECDLDGDSLLENLLVNERDGKEYSERILVSLIASSLPERTAVFKTIMHYSLAYCNVRLEPEDATDGDRGEELAATTRALEAPVMAFMELIKEAGLGQFNDDNSAIKAAKLMSQIVVAPQIADPWLRCLASADEAAVHRRNLSWGF